MNTTGPPHVRDGLDLRRAQVGFAAALAPIAIVGTYAVGSASASGASPESALLQGALHLGPRLAVAWGVGRGWEWLFALARGRAVVPGAGSVAALLVLALPPSVPLWQLALGASFAVVFGKEVFGGTGRNFVHPALVGIAFLSLAYPESMTDGARGVGLLAEAQRDGRAVFESAGMDWWDAFAGPQAGAPAEASPLACAVGGALLVHLRLVAWRVLLGGVIGLAGALVLLGVAAADVPLAQVPWTWHLVLGSFAFGLVFVATDPWSSSVTDAGRWLYGGLVGALVALLRVANPTLHDGVPFAVLLANVAAPLIDHAVIRVHVRRRRRRLA